MRQLWDVITFMVMEVREMESDETSGSEDPSRQKNSEEHLSEETYILGYFHGHCELNLGSLA